jgi:hypothetical protein
MRSDIARAITTLFVWLMGTGIVLVAIFEGQNLDGGVVVFMVLFTLMAVMGSTSFIWKDAEQASAVTQSEKGKRRGRLDRFVNDLSDHERELLLTRLSESDGELPLEKVLRRR